MLCVLGVFCWLTGAVPGVGCEFQVSPYSGYSDRRTEAEMVAGQFDSWALHAVSDTTCMTAKADVS